MSKRSRTRRSPFGLLACALAVTSSGTALAAAAPVEPYLMASPEAEIALARTAAPPSISAHATVLVLGKRGYVTAVKGSNGFVCFVTRSWDNETDATGAVFWNPKFRAPFCYNAPGARSLLPGYLRRTRWVIAGASEKEIAARDRAAWAAGKSSTPAPGALCYMMSRLGNLGGGPWHPHLMFYFPQGRTPSWGANLKGVPIMAGVSHHNTVFYIVVPYWSDGTPDSGKE